MLEYFRIYAVLALYISVNFLSVLLPLIAKAAIVDHSWLCRGILLLIALDFLAPLRPGPYGFSPLYYRLTDLSKALESYASAEIVVEGDQGGSDLYSKEKNYCICYLPHALYGHGFHNIRDYFAQKYGITALYTGSDMIFLGPILRRLMTWWGFTRVDKRSLAKNLRLRYPYNMVLLNPDGMRGMFYGAGDHEQVFLSHRKGFCKMALRTGCALVPCYVFGANHVYERHVGTGPHSWCARLSSKLRLPLLFWTDRFGIPYGFVPSRQKMVIALGRPMEVNAVGMEPSQEQVDELHSRFVHELRGLFDRNKHRMGEQWAQAHDRLYLENEPILEAKKVKTS